LPRQETITRLEASNGSTEKDVFPGGRSVGKEERAILSRIDRFVEPYRISKGKGFRLKDIDPGDTGGLGSGQKPKARELLARGVQWMAEEQDKFYADDRHAMLLVFQAMDAAGKDGTIRHVMSGVNPQGCQVFSFKQPSMEELDHDYLWRYQKCLPERGRIGIFNRSYYEEVLVVRVHPELLERQKIPQDLATRDIWKERLEDIAGFERYLARQGTIVLKFFLHVSRKEQKRRFLERLETPGKNWKFSSADVTERGYWRDYMTAYEEAIRATASKEAPWYVIPADNKWFTRLVVAAVIVDAFRKLDLAYPQVDEAKKEDLAAARQALMGGKK
jgi:PPK2 family polyphosphate:nucleotide phosphotransferase